MDAPSPLALVLFWHKALCDFCRAPGRSCEEYWEILGEFGDDPGPGPLELVPSPAP